MPVSPPVLSRLKAAVAPGAEATQFLRRAVHVESGAREGASSWTKLFGFLPLRRKAGRDRREPSLQLHAPAAAATDTGGARPSVSGIASRRDPGMDSGPAWAGGETVSARAVLGIDPRQIPSFRK